MCLAWGSNLHNCGNLDDTLTNLVTGPGFVNGGLDREGLPFIILSAFRACARSTWHFCYPIRGQK